eukprot:CAMPEP_0113896480 /NCGR_PEP_ID=MMETSP0780_2-20120614/18053_1 /TAXON_ID=652834 /ORGANISM="Palpitomonas bilix" /LENGTH=74 /DNA_ID=CAMNT_0000887649 /DNA_START=1611 /DNA_END=1832 /DNA_ORIENTATION=+ /assembly_acc=CAM_ASM_000599
MNLREALYLYTSRTRFLFLGDPIRNSEIWNVYRKTEVRRSRGQEVKSLKLEAEEARCEDVRCEVRTFSRREVRA